MYAKDNLFLGEGSSCRCLIVISDQSFAVTILMTSTPSSMWKSRPWLSTRFKTYKLGPNKSLVAVDATDRPIRKSRG